MFALSPWSLGRRAACGRRAVLLLVLATLLYGFGMHAARACVPGASAAVHHSASAGAVPCHGEIDVAQGACEVVCNTDTQSGRTSLSFDLPVAAPLDISASLAPPPPVGALALDTASPRRDTGPPLHILLHRLLR